MSMADAVWRDIVGAVLWYGFLGSITAALFFFAIFIGSPFEDGLFRWDAVVGSVVFGGPPGAATGLAMAALNRSFKLTRPQVLGLSLAVGAAVPPAVYAATNWRAWYDVVPIQIVVIGTLGAVMTLIGTAIALKLKLVRPSATVQAAP